MANIPLHSAWRLMGELPDELADAPAPAAFVLPGADALAGFSDLLGEDAAPERTQAPSGAPFPLPAMLPEAMSGAASLCVIIDFGRLRGDHALLTFDALVGSGDVLLDGERIASFGGAPYIGPLALAPCALALDLTGALHTGRRQTLMLRFSPKRPAGVPGPVILRVTRDAFLRRAVLIPQSAERRLLLRAEVFSDREGQYLLEAQPTGAPAAAVSLRVGERQMRTVELSVPMPGDLFVPGVPHDAPAIKLALYRRVPPAGPVAPHAHRRALGLLAKRHAPEAPAFARMKGARCDSAALLCGYPGEAPRAWLPLTPQECLSPDVDLCARLAALGVSGVSLPMPVCDALYRELTRLGIGVRQFGADAEPMRGLLARYPCVSFAAGQSAERSPAQTVWQLGGVVGQTRAAQPGVGDDALLEEAFGARVDPLAPGVQAVLHWLCAVHVRLLGEAARQHRYTGALCAPGAWRDPDVADALRTALAPTHVSALPLLGAWWAGTGFSASICAFVGERYGSPLAAEAALETEDGETLASERFPCPPGGGPLGVLRAALPARACALSLHTRLMAGKMMVEESVLPVYVGERGPLEAALPRV